MIATLKRLFPDFTAPRGTGWVPVLCPFHGEEHTSAALNEELDGFKCHACGVSGDSIALLRREEGLSFEEARRLAAEVEPRRDVAVRGSYAGKPGRRVPSSSRVSVRGGREVRGGVRRRPDTGA